ncbi:zinc-binding dehydrogenase [Brevundimonas naejangsanensis]
MRAMQFVGPGQPLLVPVEVPDPVAKPGWVVIDVEAAGMCHSDVGIVDGPGVGWLSHYPIILGHEVAGVVSSLGEGVTGFEIGDRVAVCLRQGRDEDYAVLGPDTHLGPNGGSAPGLHVDGGYAEKCMVRASRLMHIPDDVSFEVAAVTTDAVVTAFAAVRTTADVRLGDTVAIIGLGGLGLNGARIAHLCGAKVYGVDTNEATFPKALEAGVRECFTDISALKALKPSVIIDFAGMGVTTDAAIKAAPPECRVILVGLGSHQMTLATSPFVTKKVKLLSSLGGTREDLALAFDQIASGNLLPAVQEFAFEDINGALEMLREGKATGRLFTRPRAAASQ